MHPIADIRRETRATLAAAGLANAGAEADTLLAAVLGRSRGDIELDSLMGRSVSDAPIARVRRAVARRARREPLQHIVGIAPFGSLELAVGPGVFVPRPETEALVELAVAELIARGAQSPLAADLGSGTGAVALGVAAGLRAEGAEPDVVAVEASPHAWPWLIRNARDLGAGHVHPVFDRVGDRPLAWPGRRYDAIVSNPPYVPRASEPADPEVRGFDPEMALYGGEDGLDVIRDIAVLANRWLVAGGVVLLEHDDHQGAAVRDILTRAGLEHPVTHQDLAGRDRITGARRPADSGC
ncbi:MAG: peptide chain release factor N(5)-glutamine methyltransferase [Pseudoclavibacter sp.]